MSSGTWVFKLKEVMTTVSKLTLSKTIRSSTNLKLSSWSTQLALSLYWLKYSSKPSVDPAGPPPFGFHFVDLHPCHLNVNFFPMKKFVRTGINEGLTPFLINDSTPSFGHCLGNALLQSMRLAITANVSFLEFFI